MTIELVIIDLVVKSLIVVGGSEPGSSEPGSSEPGSKGARSKEKTVFYSILFSTCSSAHIIKSFYSPVVTNLVVKARREKKKSIFRRLSFTQILLPRYVALNPHIFRNFLLFRATFFNHGN